MRSLILLFIVLMAFQPAHADPALGFAPAAPGTDIAASLLDVVLGQPAFSSTTVSAFAAAVQVIDMAGLVFGTLMFCYLAVVGTLKTAEHGELLGKQWSSMWLPVRFVAVGALMVPGVGGYSAGQAGIVWLAKAGSSVASQAWAAAAGYVAGGGDAVAATFNSPAYQSALDSAMRTVWRATSCVEGFRRRGGLTNAQFGAQVIRLQDGSYRIEWGSQTGDSGLSTAQCGSITTAAPVQSSSSLDYVVASIDGVSTGMVALPSAPAYDASATDAVISAQVSGLLAASAALSDTAKRAAPCFDVEPCDTRGATQSEVDAAIQAAGAAYTAQVVGPVQSMYQSAIGGDRLVKRATTGGWAMAGTAMYTLVQVETQLKKLQAWVPAVVPPTERAAADTGVLGDGGVYQQSWDADIANQAEGTATTTGRALAQWVAKKLSVDPADKRHALLQLKDAGDSLMVWSQTIIAASGLAQSGASLVSKASVVAGPSAGFVGSVVGEAAGAAQYAAYVLLGTGVTMSLVIPMLPFSLWIGSLIGWVIVVLEAVVAAPVWLAAHLHPDGGDLTGKGTAGYMVLLEVVMRPVAMVLGLVAAYVLSDAALRLLGFLFWSTVDQVQVDSTTGVASMAVLVILYIGTVWTISRTCFGLIHDLPSTLMRWIGGANATHDKGAEFGAAAQSQATAGMAKAEPQWHRMLGSAGNVTGGVFRGLAGRASRTERPRSSNFIGPASRD